ncbi:hypothetical protein acdb102_05560 [Acidothermaceae bacterium B102]|nr:hypothetical protein acdb102_05560 [Acidothermaceae bacterium B102]
MTYAGPVPLLLASRVLADSGNGPDAGLGLIVFLCLLVACIFLFRSMSGRIKRLPTSFDAPADDEPVSSPDVAGSP